MYNLPVIKSFLENISFLLGMIIYSKTQSCGHPTYVDTPPLWTLFQGPNQFSLYSPI